MDRELRKALRQISDRLLDVGDRVADEGDRVYLGSTNDRDTLRNLGRELADLATPAEAAKSTNTFEVGKVAPYFCPACQAVPRAGYCKLAGCPTAPKG